MSNIIGIVTAWCAKDFIVPALQQAQDLCDEVFVCVSPHSKIMEQFDDGTTDLALEYVAEHQDIVWVNNNSRSHHAKQKCDILNSCLDCSSLMKKDNWIWLLDVDEFYTPSGLKYIHNVISQSTFDLIEVSEYYFYINMKKYLIGSHRRLFKIHDPSNRFQYPVQNWPYARNKYVTYYPVMHHYSMLMNPFAKEAFWKSEYSGKDQSYKVRWLNDIYKNYDLNNEELWISKNEELFGIRSPWFADSFTGDLNGKLLDFCSEHTKYVKHLEEIEDFRKYHGFGE